MSRQLYRRPIRIVVLTSLYPNSQQPRHGIFVEERLRWLLATGEVEARVVAPVPWFWSRHPRYGRYARLAAVPEREVRHGIEVEHPRYLVVPKIGMTLGPASMAHAVKPVLERMLRQGFEFDLIDAHYFYPDGVAAAKVARRLDRPFFVTARGADLNTIAQMRVPERQIRSAAEQAAGLITVSHSLAARLCAMGMPENRVTTLRNGVDLNRFVALDHDAAQYEVGVKGRVWLCVGHLIERKGVNHSIHALQHVPDVTLLIAGDGPLEKKLKLQAKNLSVAGRIRFLGAIAHDDLPRYYSAADALILATRSEGMPNVVLEALACGTAVLATAVDGIPEIMTGPPAGRLLRERSASAVLEAWQSLDAGELGPAGRHARRQYARDFGWEQTVQGQLALFDRVLADTPDRQLPYRRKKHVVNVSGSGY